MKKVLLINLGVLLIGLLAVELLFGNWLMPDRLNVLYVPRNVSRTYNVNHLYPSATGAVQYSRDANGLRGQFEKVEDVNLLTLGGSTTDQRYIGDGETWQDQLAKCASERGLNLKIANAGIDGQSSYGHLLALSRWLNKIPALKPKTTLVYLGTNDFLTPEAFLPDSNKGSLYEIWFRNSVVAFAARTVVGNILASKGRVAHQPVDFKTWRWSEEKHLKDIEDARTLIEDKRQRYRRRVVNLIEQIKLTGARPILVSQWEYVAKRADGRVVGVLNEKEINGHVLTGVDHFHVMQAFHEMTKQAAEETSVEYWDLAGDLIFDDEDFYDIVHNTPKGAQKIGAYLCDKFQSSSK